MSQVTSEADARLAGLDPIRLRELDDFLDRLTEDGRIPSRSVRAGTGRVTAGPPDVTLCTTIGRG